MWAEALFAISTFLFLSFNAIILIERKRKRRFIEPVRAYLDLKTVSIISYINRIIKESKRGGFIKKIKLCYSKVYAWILKHFANLSVKIATKLHKKAKEASKNTSEHLVEIAKHKDSLK